MVGTIPRGAPGLGRLANIEFRGGAFLSKTGCVQGGSRGCQMTFADRGAVERLHVAACIVRFGFRPEVVFEMLRVDDAREIRAERAAGVVAAMDHAVFAARVAG